MQQLKDGHRLTVEELGHLKSSWKDDYFNFILNIDSQIQEYVENTHAQALVLHQDLCDNNQELSDVKGLWTDSVEKFN